MARGVIKGHHVLLTGAKKILEYDADKTEDKEFSALELLNFTAYNELIISQEDMVRFQIVGEAKTKANKYGATRQYWMKLSRKPESTTGAYNTRIRNKFAKCEIYDVTRNPEEWTTKIKLLIGDLCKIHVHIDG